MRYTKSSWLVIMLALSLVLSACNFGQEPEPTPDVGVIFTAAAETVIAQFSIEQTQTAQAAPTITPIPTDTPIATFAIESPAAGSPVAPGTTPLATLAVGAQPTAFTLASPTAVAALATQGDTCLNSAFVADVTIPDGTSVKAGEWITKTWSIQNIGSCTWDDGFALVQYSGDITQSDKWAIDSNSTKKDFVEPDEIIEITLDMKVPGTAGEHGGCWRMKSDRDYFFGTPLCVLVKAK